MRRRFGVLVFLFGHALSAYVFSFGLSAVIEMSIALGRETNVMVWYDWVRVGGVTLATGM